MADFWNSWQLWVLACAIVIVVGAGVCKLIWMGRNLRKHVRILQERQAEQAALMARPSVRERKRRTEVPFGVRAIESGIEVEGVWISRPNSTATSLAQTPVLSGATSPVVSPQDVPRHGAETPVSGAARVLSNAGANSRRSSRPGTSRANSSDPFRDSRAASSRQDSGSSHSGGDTPYYDLPDAEAGLANVRVPSNPSLRSNSIRYSPNNPGRNVQPAFYRPTGTPDPHTRPRNSYIPKYLQTRALGDEGANFVYSPEEEEDFDLATSYAHPKADHASERGRLLPRERSLETSFVTPAGMMPQVHGMPGPSGHTSARSSRGYRTSTQSQYRYADASPDDQPASSFRDFADVDPHRLSRRPRSSRMPSHEEVDEQQQQQLPPTTASPASNKAKQPTTTTTPPPQSRASFATRADAEAANDDMRRVNDGFSVSRHGMRRNRESLIAEARELREDRERREREREGARRSYPQLQQQQQQQSTAAGDRTRATTRSKEADATDTATTAAAAGGRRKLQKKRASTALYPGGPTDGSVPGTSGGSEPAGKRGAPASGAPRADRAGARGQGRRNSQFREQM